MCDYYVIYSEYPILSRWFVEKKITNTIYNSNNEIETYTENFYENTVHKQLTKTHTLNSEDHILTKKIRYPQDKSQITGLNPEESQAIDKLVSQNRIAVPLETETTLSNSAGVLLSKQTQKKAYKDWGNNIVLPEKLQTSKGDSDLENRITYHKYDDFGNPLEISKTDGTHIVYIWGYQQTQPIAKIENVTYAQVQNDVANIQSKSNADDDRTIGALGKEGALRTALNNLRVALPNAMVTTYTYDPLVGVTSMTDPKGYTMYYEYDSFNRLKQVKDADGNILSENNYNYRPQN